MKKYKTIIIGVLIIIAILIGINLVGTSILPDIFGTPDVLDDDTDTSLLDRRMPAFDLPTLSGSRLRSHTLVGTPVVLVFWATWSRESADELKILDDYLLGQPTQASLVSIVAINSQEDPSVVASFVKRGGYQSMVAVDSFGDTTTAYHVKSLPTFYFVASDGSVREVYTGTLSEQNLVKKIEKLFSEPGV